MKCPFCHAQDTKVLDSRALEEGLSIRRRRKCESCERRFTTYESIEITMPLVIKNKDNRREQYNREKMASGIKKACQKLPISTDQINRMIDNIEKTIFEISEKEISSKEIGNIVMAHLKNLDPVAFVRFASVYCDFSNIEEFFRDLQLENYDFSNTKKLKKHENMVANHEH